MTDEFMQRLADVAPELTDRQLAHVRELLGDQLPSADALDGLRQLLEREDQPRLR